MLAAMTRANAAPVAHGMSPGNLGHWKTRRLHPFGGRIQTTTRSDDIAERS